MKILFIHPNIETLGKVIGNTEPYYVLKYMSKQHEITTFSCPIFRKGIYNFLPHFITFNILSVFYLHRFILKKVDLVYSYKPALVIPFILKSTQKCIWVIDLRTDPVAQEPDFWSNNNVKNKLAKLFYKLKTYSYKISLQKCDLVIVVSKALRSKLISKLKIEKKKTYLQPLGVDTSLFSGNVYDNNSFVIVYVSSIALYRGFQTCIYAAEMLLEKGYDFEWWFIGSGSKLAEKELFHLTNEMKCKQQIKWLGYIDHSKLPGLLKKCSIALSPLPDIEAYRVSSPTKVFEYMSMGIPVVASDIEAHRVLISDKGNGLLFMPGDYHDLADKIEMIYKDRGLYENIKENALKTIQSYDWNVMLRKLEKKLYDVKRNDTSNGIMKK